MSREISHRTRRTAYILFTPSNSEQRSLPTYYRGCWHVVSRSFFCGYRHDSFPPKELYTPKGFIAHAASLHQGFPHCARFPTAASRRSLARISVPVWPCALSGRLPILALVGSYLTNKLIGRGLLLRRLATFSSRSHAVLAPVSQGYSTLKGRLPTCYSPVRHCTQGLLPFLVRLACVKRAASVDSEPGSNSRLISLRYQSPQLNSDIRGSRLRPTRLSKIFAAGQGSARKPDQPQASKPFRPHSATL